MLPWPHRCISITLPIADITCFKSSIEISCNIMQLCNGVLLEMLRTTTINSLSNNKCIHSKFYHIILMVRGYLIPDRSYHVPPLWSCNVLNNTTWTYMIMLRSIFLYVHLYRMHTHTNIYTQIAKFMGPIWGPPGSCRPQMGPMLAP